MTASSASDGSEDPSAARDESPRTAAKGHRRRIMTGSAVALVVAGSIGGYLGWKSWTMRAVQDVHVSWAGAPRCDGTGLLKNRNEIEWNARMSCVITVLVENEGSADVHADRVIMPYMGPGGGGVVEAGQVDGKTPVPLPGRDIDATFDLDHDIRPGDTWTFRTRVVFRPNGCTSKGALMLGGWPAVDVTARGREVLVHSDRTLAVHSSRQNPGCELAN